MRHHPDIVPRDDNMFDVVSGDIIAGPFPTTSFAMQVASGEKPAPIDNIGGNFGASGSFWRCRLVACLVLWRRRGRRWRRERRSNRICS
jgi:hypothetical protein